MVGIWMQILDGLVNRRLEPIGETWLSWKLCKRLFIKWWLKTMRTKWMLDADVEEEDVVSEEEDVEAEPEMDLVNPENLVNLEMDLVNLENLVNISLEKKDNRTETVVVVVVTVEETPTVVLLVPVEMPVEEVLQATTLLK
jgi:hypothetical protein